METVEHALGCAVRVIRTLLGPSAVDDSKVAFGMSLSVLGCTLESDKDGFRCFPTADKVRVRVKCLYVRWNLHRCHDCRSRNG